MQRFLCVFGGVFATGRILPVILGFTLSSGSVCADDGEDKLSAAESKQLNDLRLDYDLASQKIRQEQLVEPMEKLRSAYKAKMKQVLEKFSRAGDLAKTLEARTAAKTDPTAGTIHPEVKEIAEVQEVFLEVKKKTQARLDESLTKLARDHVAQLATIKDEMIKVSRLDSALVVEGIIHEFQNEAMLLSSSAVRSFEDQFGRMMVAKLVAHAGIDAETVEIEKGGKKMAVRIDAFSEKDQQFIREWMKRTPPALSASLKKPRLQLKLKPKHDEKYSWKIATVDSEGDVGFNTSLAFSLSGQPAISYYDSTNKDLKFALFDGQKWTKQTIDSEGDVGRHISLAFSPSGHPAISYYDSTNKDLKYASFDGRKWTLQTCDSGGDVGGYASLAFSPSGQPAISYCDYTNNDLKFALFDGEKWSYQIIDSVGATRGDYTSLAFSPSGHPAISYYDSANKDLKFALFDGRKWKKQTIDSEGDVGRRSSLAFSPSGGPAISYRDYTKKDLKYASFDGWKWAKQVIDSSGSVGMHTHLAFGPFGHPAISSRDYTKDILKYASFDGRNWTKQTIGSKGNGGSTSLAFSPSGHPAISYYDYKSKDLKFAHRVIVKK